MPFYWAKKFVVLYEILGIIAKGLRTSNNKTMDLC